MAAPVFRAAGTAVSGLAGVTPGLPTGHALNDILLLFVQSSNEVITAPAGYVEVTNSPQGTGTAATAGSVRLGVFWKRDNGSESAPTVADTGNHTIAMLAAYSGCITSGNPWDVTNGGVDTSTTTAAQSPALTTTVADTHVVFAAANATDSTTLQFSGIASAGNLTSVSVKFEGNTNSGTGGGFSVLEGDLAAAGDAVGSGLTINLLNATKTGKVVIALKPPATVTTIGGFNQYYTNIAGGVSF